VPRILRLTPDLDEDKALFVADKWAEAGADGVVRLKSDSAHKLPNAVLYRRQEAAACWAKVTAPVLVVVGADTDHTRYLRLWTDADSAPFRRQQIATIDGAGHMIHFDQPDALAAAIEEFLAAQ
jgi:pimeloyl-ACP methyl ester carboxylesterase